MTLRIASDFAFATHSNDSADCSDYAFAAKKICSKRWSHCPETIVTIGTGTLSVAKEESPKDTTLCSRGECPVKTML